MDKDDSMGYYLRRIGRNTSFSINPCPNRDIQFIVTTRNSAKIKKIDPGTHRRK